MASLITTELLTGLLSADPAIRSQAEHCYASTSGQRLEPLTTYLVSDQSGNAACHHLAAVLLRREILSSTPEHHPHVAQALQSLPPTAALMDCFTELCFVTPALLPTVVSHTTAVCRQVRKNETALLLLSCFSHFVQQPQQASLCLRLWCALAERCPKAWHSAGWPTVQSVQLPTTAVVWRLVLATPAAAALVPNMLSRQEPSLDITAELLEAAREGRLTAAVQAYCRRCASPNLALIDLATHDETTRADVERYLPVLWTHFDSWAWMEEEEESEDAFIDDAAYAAELLGALLTQHPDLLDHLIGLPPTVGHAVWSVAADTLPRRVRAYLPTVRDFCVAHGVPTLHLIGRVLELEEEENRSTVLLPMIVQALASPQPAVVAAACRTLVTYYRPRENVPPPEVTAVWQALVAGPLATNSVVLQRLALGAVAVLATAAEDFSELAPAVLAGLPACGEAAWETAAFVGRAAPSVFDGHVWLRQLVNGSVVSLEQLTAGVRMASAMGAEAFSPYAESVLQQLLAVVTEQTEVDISEGTELTRGVRVEEGRETVTLAVPGKGLAKMTMNTAKVQDKATATRAIYELAVTLGEHFGPFCNGCLNACMPNLTYRYSGDVRSTAALTLSAVFEAACEYGEVSNNMDLAQSCFVPLVKGIATQIVQEDVQDDMENINGISEGLSEIFYSAYSRRQTGVLRNYSLEDARFVVQHCISSLTECFERRQTISNRLASATTEDEVAMEQDMLDTEDKIMTPLVDSIGYTLKSFKESFVPIFDSDVANVLGQYLQPGADLSARVAAVCLFDDCVEHCGSVAAATHAPRLLVGAMAGLTTDRNIDLVRASVYGIAQIARYAPKVLMPHGREIVERVMMLCRKDTTVDPSVYENAVSALGSLVVFSGSPFRGSSFVKREQAIEVLLSAMPLTDDFDEAQICHAGFCELLEAGEINLTASYKLVLSAVSSILTFVEDGNDLATPDTCSRLALALTRLQQQIPAENMNQWFGELSQESQVAVQTAIAQVPSAHTGPNVVTP